MITGVSGAGRSTAADTMEDLGWFVIDNLPANVISKVADLVGRPGSETERVAFVVGRGAYDDGDFTEAIEHLRRTGSRVRVLFLEASTDELIRRFEGTRRRHPVHASGPAESIEQERELLDPVKAQADVVIDTTDLNVHQLHDRLVDLFATHEPTTLKPTIVSFGYKHGIPMDVDLMFDCRFLPNPHWVEELRPFSGLDEPVRDYVLGQEATKEFLAKLEDLFAILLPGYVKEGKSYLTIGVGCTGGHHRSVALAEELSRIIQEQGFNPSVIHRDVEK